MNHIVVPVDLSGNSKAALRYAAHLAARVGADLKVVHCYTLLQKAVSYTIGQAVPVKDPEKWIQKRIVKLKRKHRDLVIDYAIKKENVVDSLQKMMEAGEADLVVMGAQGVGENHETFLGSTAGAMVKTTEIPILLIPGRYKFKGIDKVVFAAKNTFVKFMGPLEPIITIKQVFKPHIELLHLGEQPDPMPEQSFSILQVINDITRYGNDNFNESINEFLSQHHADLLCVIRRKRGFLEKMLGPTGTPSSRFHVDIPVLVLIGEDY
jgi:nucleotide-binding universal stress UspA family protein